MTVPNAEPVSGEDLEAQFGDGGEGATGGAPAGEPTGGGAAGEGTTPPAGPARVKVGEAEYDEAELRGLIEFQEWAQANQDKMQAFSTYLRGEADFTPKSQEPVKPSTEGAPEDPYAAIEDEGLRERLRTQEQQLEALRQQSNQQITASSLQEAERGINRAYDTIKERYGLDDEQVRELANATAQSGILPGIRATQPDPYEAALAALDTTIWRDDKWRNSVVEKEILRIDEHQKRQQLAGAVGGSPGSVSREVPSDQEVAKMSGQEKIDAMAAEVAHAMRGHT